MIEAGLKCVQGKAIVNSISMKEGEETFLAARPAGAQLRRRRRRHGLRRDRARPTRYERKVEICTRAYKLLTEEVGFPPEDIIFDPNVFAVATGIEEHNNYGVDFIEATREITRDPAARPHLGRRLEPVLLVPRQRAGARGDALRCSSTTPSRRAWTWASSMPASSRSTTDRPGTARGLRGRGPQPPRRRDRAAARDRRALSAARPAARRGRRT